jgi:predicted nucleic acid-binding protein
LVTGDKKLLSLGNYQGVPILSPRDFYERVRLGG